MGKSLMIDTFAQYLGKTSKPYNNHVSPYLRPNGQPVSVVEDPLEEAHLVGVAHDEGHMGGRQRGRGQEGLAAHQLVAPVAQDGGDAQVADEGQVAVAHQQVDDGQAEVLY